jgi:hypothetical protein
MHPVVHPFYPVPVFVVLDDFTGSDVMIPVNLPKNTIVSFKMFSFVG